MISGTAQQEIIEVQPGKVMLQWIDEGGLYVPSVGNIGVYCDLDALPRTLEIYQCCRKYLREKIELKITVATDLEHELMES